jgi:hypothetical protein
MANDPTAKAAVAELGWTSETVKDIANAVASVKVCGMKPTE